MKPNWFIVIWAIGVLMIIGVTYGDTRSRLESLEKKYIELETKSSVMIDKQDLILERLTTIEVKLDERTKKGDK